MTNTSVVATQKGPYLRTSNPVVCQHIAAYLQNDKFHLLKQEISTCFSYMRDKCCMKMETWLSSLYGDGNDRGKSCTHKSALSVVLSKKSALYDPITESLILIRISCNSTK